MLQRFLYFRYASFGLNFCFDSLTRRTIIPKGQYYFLWGKESVSYHFDTI